eukprot:sb/3472956/
MSHLVLDRRNEKAETLRSLGLIVSSLVRRSPEEHQNKIFTVIDSWSTDKKQSCGDRTDRKSRDLSRYFSLCPASLYLTLYLITLFVPLCLARVIRDTYESRRHTDGSRRHTDGSRRHSGESRHHTDDKVSHFRQICIRYNLKRKPKGEEPTESGNTGP